MASIIKIPTEKSKGVVIFTTQDRDNFILGNKKLEYKIISIKDKWLVGLHHNWHDYKFQYNSVFDFSLAGKEDLIEKDNLKFDQINIDACNFSPSFFKPIDYQTPKHWDILYVARAVWFKNIPEFFKMIRSLYDRKFKYRVLLICPIPPNSSFVKSKYIYQKVRKDYEKIFSHDERKMFTLLTTDFDDPFPFDLETLSLFYKNSKIFVHSAENERRCREKRYGIL